MSLIPDNVETSTETTETTEVETPQETTETSEVTETTETTEESKFLFADGIEGKGEAPEWFKSSKYKTVSDQAKAYTDLEGKFGSFTGAPKEGKYEVEGVDFEENTLMATVAEWGIENQLSQEGLEGLVIKVRELAEQQTKEDQENAKGELGDRADQRLADLSSWGRNNLSPDEYTQFQGLAQTAGQVNVLEKMIGMTKNSKMVNADNVTSSKSREDMQAELQSEYLATNDKGQRLMGVDPKYRARVQKKMKEFYGE